MKKSLLGIASLLIATTAVLGAQQASNLSRIDKQHAGGGKVVTPESSIALIEDAGLRAHTNFKIFVPAGRSEELAGFTATKTHPNGTPVSGYYAETPASLACIYGLTTWTAGCNPYYLANSAHATGGSKAIAIVDAYHYPNALVDLQAYSTAFGLPAPNLTVTWASTTRPPVQSACVGNGWNCWAAESALDIEMAHAMAPSAKIYLVEAASNSYADLFAAVNKATTLVQAAGGGEVSMSWSGGEGSGETVYDSYMLKSKVVYFASTGDSEGTGYPSTSPNVVAVGGTTLMRNPATLDLEAEVAWEDGGGGTSPVESRPSYQNSIASIVGSYRGVPDISAVANPRTGVWVYDSYQTGTGHWNIFGGTSVSSPLMAGIVNNAGHFYTNTPAELTAVYGAAAKSSNWRDITYGTCGYYEGWYAIAGWDPCTGKGAPYGRTGK